MLEKRIATAVVLLTCFAAVLFLAPNMAAAAVFAGVAAAAAWEWSALTRSGERARLAFVAVVLASCFVAWIWRDVLFYVLWSISAGFWLILAPPWLFKRPRANLFVGWIVLLPTWAALVELHARSPWLLLAVAGVVWVADISAYFVGRAIGRRRLAPGISPGKTWEGVSGAVLGVLVYGIAIDWLPVGVSGLIIDAIGADDNTGRALLAIALLLLTVMSIIGDLFESLVKRQAGVKDSGRLLPGHGGLLDRIDSLCAVLPLSALLLYWIGR